MGWTLIETFTHTDGTSGSCSISPDGSTIAYGIVSYSDDTTGYVAIVKNGTTQKINFSTGLPAMTEFIGYGISLNESGTLCSTTDIGYAFGPSSDPAHLIRIAGGDVFASNSVQTSTLFAYDSTVSNTAFVNNLIAYTATASGAGGDYQSTAFGYGALANTSSYSTAVGYGALTDTQGNQPTGSTAVGWNALACGSSTSVAAGYAAHENQTGSSGQNVAVGYRALQNANGTDSIAVGYNALQNPNARSTQDCIAIGASALVYPHGNDLIAIGSNALQNSDDEETDTCIVIGNNSLLHYGGSNVIVIGHNVDNANQGIVIGHNSMCNDNPNSIALGSGISVGAPNVIVLGTGQSVGIGGVYAPGSNVEVNGNVFVSNALTTTSIYVNKKQTPTLVVENTVLTQNDSSYGQSVSMNALGNVVAVSGTSSINLYKFVDTTWVNSGYIDTSPHNPGQIALNAVGDTLVTYYGTQIANVFMYPWSTSPVPLSNALSLILEYSCAISADGMNASFVTFDGSLFGVSVFKNSLGTWTEYPVLPGFSDPIFSVSLSGDGKTLAACTRSQIFVQNGTLWDTFISVVYPPDVLDFQTVSLNSDGTYLAVGSGTNIYVFSYDGSAFNVQQTIPSSNDPRKVQISSDALSLIASDTQNTASVFTRSGTTWTFSSTYVFTRLDFNETISVSVNSTGTAYIASGISRIGTYGQVEILNQVNGVIESGGDVFASNSVQTSTLFAYDANVSNSVFTSNLFAYDTNVSNSVFTYDANVSNALALSYLNAGGSFGSPGQFLTSNATANTVYWSSLGGGSVYYSTTGQITPSTYTGILYGPTMALRLDVFGSTGSSTYFTQSANGAWQFTQTGVYNFKAVFLTVNDYNISGVGIGSNVIDYGDRTDQTYVYRYTTFVTQNPTPVIDFDFQVSDTTLYYFIDLFSKGQTTLQSTSNVLGGTWMSLSTVQTTTTTINVNLLGGTVPGQKQDYVASTTDYYIGMTNGGTVTLPASGLVVGKQYVVKDEGGVASTNPVTISGNGYSIDGTSQVVLNINWASVTLLWTGTKWSII